MTQPRFNATSGKGKGPLSGWRPVEPKGPSFENLAGILAMTLVAVCVTMRISCVVFIAMFFGLSAIMNTKRTKKKKETLIAFTGFTVLSYSVMIMTTSYMPLLSGKAVRDSVFSPTVASPAYVAEIEALRASGQPLQKGGIPTMIRNIFGVGKKNE